ncbi:MAG: PKD domain-containing protein [Nitrososphaerales archaeon]
MLFHLGQSKALAGITVICAILSATLLAPAATAAKLTITVDATQQGAFLDFDVKTSFPVTVGFSIKSSSPGSTVSWQFGDGTSSTDAAPNHVFSEPCVYNIRVQVTASNGSIASGNVVFGAFDATVPSGRAIAVCPPQGTEGFIPVQLGGGYFSPNQHVSVLMDGVSITTVTADSGGDWILNVTGFLTPQPNGTQYTFTTSPASVASAFTTLEGVRGTPAAGAPGDSVVIEGRSYPQYSTVLVYLAGVSLGAAQTDSSGLFLTTFQIPYTSPLTQAGTYPYATFPPILGSQANFKSAGNTIVGVLFSWWWWLLLIILFLVAAYLVRRRMKRRATPLAQG